MAMRTDCRHYESRTYASGEVVRKCRLDLAPEAPWRCPEHCPEYSVRRIDVGWQYGSLAPEPSPEAPDLVDADDPSVAALLDAAEDIVNSAAPEILADVDPRKAKRRRRRKGR